MTMKTKFLHIEDNNAWQENFRDLAESLEIDITQCTTRTEALIAMQEVRPDIVITDLHLGPGDSSGYAIAAEARERGVPHITIASETGSPSQQVPDVEIRDKVSAGNWLISLVKGNERR